MGFLDDIKNAFEGLIDDIKDGIDDIWGRGKRFLAVNLINSGIASKKLETMIKKELTKLGIDGEIAIHISVVPKHSVTEEMEFHVDAEIALGEDDLIYLMLMLMPRTASYI